MTENPSTEFWARFRAAQAEMRDPTKDATNPHFKSRFVTLKGVLDAIRPSLHKHGLSIVQQIEGTSVITRIYGDDGTSVASSCPVICAKPNDPQAFGSALTYARRYGAAALCSLAPADEDDDAEGATDHRAPAPTAKPAPAPKVEPFAFVEEAIEEMLGAADQKALGKVAERIRASQFKGEDHEKAKQCYKERFAELTLPATKKE